MILQPVNSASHWLRYAVVQPLRVPVPVLITTVTLSVDPVPVVIVFPPAS